MKTMKKLTPNLMVENVNETVKYYSQILGFEFAVGVDEKKEMVGGDFEGRVLTWAMIKNGGVEIMLQRRDSLSEELSEFTNSEIGGSFTLYIDVADVKALYEEIKQKVTIVKDMRKTFYGADEFIIKDLNGYILYFAQSQNG